jgi:hypothetical protein
MYFVAWSMVEAIVLGGISFKKLPSACKQSVTVTAAFILRV